MFFFFVGQSEDRNETKHKYKSVFCFFFKVQKKNSKQVYGRGRVIGSLVYVLHPVISQPPPQLPFLDCLGSAVGCSSSCCCPSDGMNERVAPACPPRAANARWSSGTGWSGWTRSWEMSYLCVTLHGLPPNRIHAV